MTFLFLLRFLFSCCITPRLWMCRTGSPSVVTWRVIIRRGSVDACLVGKRHRKYPREKRCGDKSERSRVEVSSFLFCRYLTYSEEGSGVLCTWVGVGLVGVGWGGVGLVGLGWEDLLQGIEPTTAAANSPDPTSTSSIDCTP